MTKKKLSILAVTAHVIVAAVAIYADVTQPARARTWLPLLGGYIATALIVTTVMYLGNANVPSKPVRTGISLVLGILFSGFLWIATYSLFLMSVLLYRRF
ncbi:MAG TPA: hypothetical protein VGF48_13700 [Thermoanaerobaculia bacterium]|jgi:hypothetical protein